MSLAERTDAEAPPAVEEARAISQTLAVFAARLDLDEVPPEVIERAKLHILDGLGVGLVASGYEFAACTLAGLRALCGEGDLPVIGMAARLDLRDAVLMNGTLIHGLDFDDTHPAAIVHPTVSALSTVLSLAAREGLSGREALAAYLVAIEADARIGMAAGRGAFHDVGLHPTGVVGAFGCALAAGRLLGLDESQLAHAQGIVLSMAAGSFQFLDDGAWTKRMHPGWAGVCGITAAALAKGGFVGPERAYEGRFGLYKLHLDRDAVVDLDACTAGLGSNWEMMRVALKPYPACHFNHAFAGAILELKQGHGLKPAEVASVTALIGEGQIPVVCEPLDKKRRPANAYEAQFSVPYIVAASLVNGRFTLAELEEDRRTDPETLALCQKVGYEIDPNSAYPQFYSGEVIVETHDGRTLRHREAVNRGAHKRPLSRGAVIGKFRDNALRALPEARVDAVQEAVMALDSGAGMAALGDLLGGQGGKP